VALRLRRAGTSSVEAGDAFDVGTLAAQQYGEAAALVGVDAPTQHGQCHGEGAFVLAGQRTPAVPQQDPSLAVAGGDVGQAVREGVEVLPVVAGEVQRLTDGGEELGLGRAVPPVDRGEPPARVLDGVAYVVHLEGTVPPVDPRLGVVGQEPGQSAHLLILSNDR
jgi:hypothetical protein